MKLPNGYVHQHTLFERRIFNAQPLSKEWRHNPGMILIMPEADEKALHREMEGLPLPSRLLARRALLHLESMPLDFSRVERFMSVKALMWDIADRREGTARGTEAQIFAEHFETQNCFYGGVLNAEEELELRRFRDQVG